MSENNSKSTNYMYRPTLLLKLVLDKDAAETGLLSLHVITNKLS